MKRRAHAVTVLLAACWLLLTPGLAAAQYANPSAAPVTTTGDPRSTGQGPGIVGTPVEIALAIVGLGLVTIAGTVLVVRLTQRR